MGWCWLQASAASAIKQPRRLVLVIAGLDWEWVLHIVYVASAGTPNVAMNPVCMSYAMHIADMR